jgi:FtsP/CotA-like multicopper oxidase with cupredoxin domain
LKEKKMNRRDLIKYGLAGGAALAARPKLWADRGGRGGSGSGSGGDSGGGGTSGGGTSGGGGTVPGGNVTPDNLRPSPPTRAFVQPLPIMPVLQPTTQSSMTGAAIDPVACISPEDCIQRSTHQYYNQFAPVKWYELHEKEVPWNFSPDLPASPIWAFNGNFPGPTVVSHYGEPALVRIHNELPPTSDLGFGLPSTTTHLHNGHTASESDGFPGDWVNPGQFHDHHYPHCLPGFTMSTGQDKKETLGTLWYHDHRMDFTAQNTYAGLVGYHLLFDDVDTGDETTGLRLPSGKYDVPLIFADRAFDPNTGIIFFDLLNLDGMLGDKWLVNGVIQPFFQVEPRKYRFRFLGVGPSRFWEFHLSDDSYMAQIGEDGNLFAQPIWRQGIRQGVAERTDVIIDFSKYKMGTSIYLQNRLEQKNGRGPTGNILNPGDPLLRFDVVLPLSGKDNSQIPTFMRTQPAIDPNQIVANRTFRIERSNGGWAINGQFFDVNRIDAHVKRNTAEVWTLQNNSGSWSHPVHIHFEEFRILNRNGFAPPANELGRKDVIKLGPNEQVTFYMRFRDWTGRYPMHCHNTVHEDHSMMIRWELES